LDFDSRRLRVLLGVWVLLLVFARAAPAWLDVPNDERRLAAAVQATVPRQVNEVAFVETAPRYGLRLYLGSSVERINLPGTDAEPESEPLNAELAESEGCRLILVDSLELAALQHELRRVTRAWRELGQARGYRVLLIAGEDDCGLPAP